MRFPYKCSCRIGGGLLTTTSRCRSSSAATQEYTLLSLCQHHKEQTTLETPSPLVYTTRVNMNAKTLVVGVWFLPRPLQESTTTTAVLTNKFSCRPAGVHKTRSFVCSTHPTLIGEAIANWLASAGHSSFVLQFSQCFAGNLRTVWISFFLNDTAD